MYTIGNVWRLLFISKPLLTLVCGLICWGKKRSQQFLWRLGLKTQLQNWSFYVVYQTWKLLGKIFAGFFSVFDLQLYFENSHVVSSWSPSSISGQSWLPGFSSIMTCSITLMETYLFYIISYHLCAKELWNYLSFVDFLTAGLIQLLHTVFSLISIGSQISAAPLGIHIEINPSL